MKRRSAHNAFAALVVFTSAAALTVAAMGPAGAAAPMSGVLRAPVTTSAASANRPAKVMAKSTKRKAKVVVYKNCAALNKVYPHGVGRPGARDHTSGKPDTRFAVNKAVYRANTARDRDKDGIACER